MLNILLFLSRAFYSLALILVVDAVLARRRFVKTVRNKSDRARAQSEDQFRKWMVIAAVMVVLGGIASFLTQFSK